MSTFNGTIDVTIADAKIQTQDFGSKQDPYCVVTLGSSGLRRFLEGETFGKESFQTRVQNEAGQHPVWNESYTLSLKNMKLDSHLKVKLYDKDMINDDFLGVAKIDLSDLLPQDNQGVKYYPLYARGALEMGRSDVIGQVGIGVAFHCTEIPQTQGETKTYATGTVPTYTGETQPTYTDSSYAQAQPVYAQPTPAYAQPAYAQPAYAQPAYAQAQPAYAQSGDSTKSTGIGGGLLGLITEIADMVIQGPQTVNQPTQDTYQSQDSSQSGTYPQSGTSSTYPQSGTYSQSDAFSQGQKQHDHSGATKKALQFGLLYRGTQNQLEGCINDVNDVKDQFLTQIGFSERDITQVTDDTKIKPTKENMMQLISQLVSQAGDGEVLFLQYSGHGTQVKDASGDERDGQDEAICPLDFQSSGVLVDDWMFENFVKPLEAKPKTHAFAVIDACHSGTFLDLAYQYVAERGPKPHVKQAGEGRRARKNRSSSAFVIGFSAALDNQTSIDTQEGGIPQGAFTYAFLQVVQDHIQRPKTYRQFLLEVDGILASQGFKCQASLSSSQPIDLDREFREW